MESCSGRETDGDTSPSGTCKYPHLGHNRGPMVLYNLWSALSDLSFKFQSFLPHAISLVPRAILIPPHTFSPWSYSHPFQTLLTSAKADYALLSSLQGCQLTFQEAASGFQPSLTLLSGPLSPSVLSSRPACFFGCSSAASGMRSSNGGLVSPKY